jgi:hypothetical protein
MRINKKTTPIDLTNSSEVFRALRVEALNERIKEIVMKPTFVNTVKNLRDK